MNKLEEYDGFSVVKDEITSKYGLVNPNNDLLVPCEMDEITSYLPDIYTEGWMGTIDCFLEMGILICRKESNYGIIIPSLDKYIEPSFQLAAILKTPILMEDEETGEYCEFEEYVRVDVKIGPDKYGYLDENGDLIPCEYEESAFHFAHLEKDFSNDMLSGM